MPIKKRRKRSLKKRELVFGFSIMSVLVVIILLLLIEIAPSFWNNLVNWLIP